MSTTQRNEVESLLERLEETRKQIVLARTYGVQPAGLRELKQAFRSTQQELVGLH